MTGSVEKKNDSDDEDDDINDNDKRKMIPQCQKIFDIEETYHVTHNTQTKIIVIKRMRNKIK